MHVKLFATLAETAEGEVEVTPEDDDLRAAVDALVAEHPGLREEMLTEDGDLREHVRLLVDGTDPFATGEGWATPVAGAEVAVFPPVSGG